MKSFISAHHVSSKRELEQVISQVSFSPSCLDMGWAWEISEVDKSLPTSYRSSETVGWHIRCSFKRPDTNTGEMGTGFGRWWFIEKDTTVNGIVKTMWAACKMIVEHELHEAFLYQGKRLFDPHAEVDDLIEKVSRN